MLDEPVTQEPEKRAPRPRRDDKPKVSPKEDAANRIKGLEASKLEPGMSKQDIDALERVIIKLREKLNG